VVIPLWRALSPSLLYARNLRGKRSGAGRERKSTSRKEEVALALASTVMFLLLMDKAACRFERRGSAAGHTQAGDPTRLHARLMLVQARTFGVAAAWDTAIFARIPEHMAEQSITSFLNVDLDLRGVLHVEELLEALGDRVVVLNQGATTVSLELATQPSSAEEAVMELLSLVERLPSSLREDWHRYEARVLNIGIQAGAAPYAFHCGLSREALRRLSAMEGEVIFTLYAVPTPRA
jgi:hypothetical protein